jgi:hypothetical protein
MAAPFDFVFVRLGGGVTLQGYGLPADMDVALDSRQELEPMTTPGVDGTRFRKTRSDWPPLEIVTNLPASSYNALLLLEDDAQNLQGAVGRLQLGFGPIVRSWRATLVRCSTRRIGAMVGPITAPYCLELSCTVQRQEKGQ